MIRMIVARSKNGVIGKDNDLIWKIPEDLKYFKRVTTGKDVLMGRKTYESIGRPLPNRRNLILSREKSLSIDGCLIYNRIDEVISIFSDIFVIGGSEVYKMMLPHADEIYITQIDKEFEGDTYFDDLDQNRWKLESSVKGEECKDFDYYFQKWIRK